MSFSSSASLSDSPSSLQPGDTLVYEVTLADISDGLTSLTNETLSVSNLVGTEIGFRIFSAGADSYNFGTFLQIGANPVTFTVKSGNFDQLSLDHIGNDSIEMELESFIDLLTPLGDVPFTLPEDSVIPLGGNTEAPFDISDFKGIPLWIKNVDWSAVKILIDSTSSVTYDEDFSSKTITVTLEMSNVFSVSFTYSTALTDAVLTKLEINADIESPHDFHLVIEYRETNHFSLPEDFAVNDVYNYKFDVAKLDISHDFEETTEDFINSLIKANDETGEFEDLRTSFNSMETFVSELKDQTFMEYKILSIDGTTFDARVSQPLNDKKPNFETTFDGFMSSKANSTGPLVIPEWNFWESGFSSFDTLGTFLTAFLSDTTANQNLKDKYTELGFAEGPTILSSFDSSISEGIHYFSVSFALDFEFSSTVELSTILELLEFDDFPFQGSPFVDLTVTTNNTFGIAFSDDGYLLSTGFNGRNSLDFDISFFNTGTASANQFSLGDFKGSIDMDIEMATSLSSDSVNVAQSTLDDANKAKSVLLNEVIKFPVVNSPGYTILITFIGLIGVIAFSRRLKR
ncbi:MAG: hypothetical protein ACXACX_20670 [Candidatus Hodarchaeales archaeon]|jgi:hypothetical protein